MLTPREFGIKVAHTIKRAQYPMGAPSAGAGGGAAAAAAPVPPHKRVNLPAYSNKQYGKFHEQTVKALNLPADTTPEAGYQALVDGMTNGTLTPGQRAILKPMFGPNLPRFSQPAASSPAVAGPAVAPGPVPGPAAAEASPPRPATLTNKPIAPNRAMTLDELFGPETAATGPAPSRGPARPTMRQMPAAPAAGSLPVMPKNVKPAVPKNAPAIPPKRFVATPGKTQPASFAKLPMN